MDPKADVGKVKGSLLIMMLMIKMAGMMGQDTGLTRMSRREKSRARHSIGSNMI